MPHEAKPRSAAHSPTTAHCIGTSARQDTRRLCTAPVVRVAPTFTRILAYIYFSSWLRTQSPFQTRPKSSSIDIIAIRKCLFPLAVESSPQLPSWWRSHSHGILCRVSNNCMHLNSFRKKSASDLDHLKIRPRGQPTSNSNAWFMVTKTGGEIDFHRSYELSFFFFFLIGGLLSQPSVDRIGNLRFFRVRWPGLCSAHSLPPFRRVPRLVFGALSVPRFLRYADPHCY